MSDLIPFDFQGADVRVVEHEGEAWFVAKDVALALGYQKPRNAVSAHCRAAKSLIELGGLESGLLDPQTIVIPERDIYRLVMRSRLPSAERFEEWVVGEVLPTIRKTGSYDAQEKPQDFATALRAYADEVEAREAAQKQIERDKPYTELGLLVAGQETMTRRDWCALMKREYGVVVKEKLLTSWLIEQGYCYRDQLTRQLRAYANHDELFKLEAQEINGAPRLMLKITGEGVKQLTEKVVHHFDPDP